MIWQRVVKTKPSAQETTMVRSRVPVVRKRNVLLKEMEYAVQTDRHTLMSVSWRQQPAQRIGQWMWLMLDLVV